MGTWGYYSEENDNVMDIVEDSHEQTDEKIERILAKSICSDQSLLGSVVWFVKWDKKVDRKYIEFALELIDQELKGDNEGEWADFEKRKSALYEEKDLLTIYLVSLVKNIKRAKS